MEEGEWKNTMDAGSIKAIKTTKKPSRMETIQDQSII